MLAVDFRLPNPKFLNLWFIELMWAGVMGGRREKRKEEDFSVRKWCGIGDYHLARMCTFKGRRLTKSEGQEERGVVVSGRSLARQIDCLLCLLLAAWGGELVLAAGLCERLEKSMTRARPVRAENKSWQPKDNAVRCGAVQSRVSYPRV